METGLCLACVCFLRDGGDGNFMEFSDTTDGMARKAQISAALAKNKAKAGVNAGNQNFMMVCQPGGHYSAVVDCALFF
jgi:hypothetical protein